MYIYIICFVNYGLSENIGQLKMPLTEGKIKNGVATNKNTQRNHFKNFKIFEKHKKHKNYKIFHVFSCFLLYLNLSCENR